MTRSDLSSARVFGSSVVILGFALACSGAGGDGDSGGPGAGGSSGSSGGNGGSGAAWGGASGSAGQAWGGSAGTTSGGAGGAGGSSAAGGSGAAGGVGGTGGSGGAPLACDPGFSLSQNPALAGVPFDVSFTANDGWAYVDMEVSGPGSPSSAWGGVAGNGPYTWTWTISGHDQGVLTLVMKKDKNNGPGQTMGTCQVYSDPNGGSGGSSGGGSGGSSGGGTGGSSGGSSGPPPTNRYGMGYVNEGSTADHDLTAALTGPGGWVTVIFADIHPGRSTAEQSWKNSIQAAYDRDLIPVIRMAPPWGNRNVRAMGENPKSYQGLANAYVNVINDLPRRADWPLYIQVHNEPNLCYEWECSGMPTISGTQIAQEYAHMLADVADAIHANTSNVQVLNGALAPGGVTSCTCGTDQFTGGALATDFLNAMKAEVPNVFDKIDAFASHSYPSVGEGWGFFRPYSQSLTGLKYFENELAAIGKPNMLVLITETGWTTQHEDQNHTREQVAQFTLDALTNVWLTHPNILGFTPFILRDGSWDKFAWVQGNGTPYPVYTTIKNHRCSQPGAQGC